MNERKKQRDLPSRTGSEDDETVRVSRLSQNKSKTNRLSRSLRPTQKSPSLDPSYNCHRELKTPKRHTRIRTNILNQCDSPSNDSDLQQDIIWDPTSPTPVCNGKEAKKSSTNVRVVDISELVNRIAPKNERPVVPELSLLQWIGDTVPCTPEVRQPRMRRKSTRQNDVEDLMKLAKQFDFNMHQQDKVQAQEPKEESANQDVDGLGSQGNDLPPSPDEAPTTSKGAVLQTPDSGEQTFTTRGPLDQEMEDDLDALFDGPTQHISRRLSQSSSICSQGGRAPPVTASSEGALPEKGSDLGPSGSSVSSAPVKKLEGMPNAQVSCRLMDDDWDNDDLLNDSLVLEMTQNPDLFVSPKHCSTQIGSRQKQNYFVNKPSAINGAPGQLPRGSCGNGFGGLYQGKNSKSRNRSTFKLETNPNFLVNETLSGGEMSSCHGLESSEAEEQGGRQSRKKCLFQPNRAVSLEPSHQSNERTRPIPIGERENRVPRPVLQQSSSAPSSSGTTRPVQADNQVSVVRGTNSVESGRREEKRTKDAGVAQNRPVDAVLAEDLDLIFDSDSLWDDGDDDNLLCQLCDDVEKLSESPAPRPATARLEQTGPKSIKGAAAAESSSRGQKTGGAQAKPQCAFSRSNSIPGYGVPFTKTAPQVSVGFRPTSGSVIQNNTISATNGAQSSASWQQGASSKGSYKFTHLKKSSLLAGANSGTTPGPPYAENVQRARNPASSHHHSFKRHLSEPIALNNKVFVQSKATVKCSEAQIERKKQEALARRRLRIQTSQKHGGPT